MSARRLINSRMGRNQGQGGGSIPRAVNGGNVHYVAVRQDVVTRKREERTVREAFRREKKMTSYLEEDENFPNFRNQLAKLGLELRDIPGDGNCLFRALGDQYEGHVRNHFRHRHDVVKYMVDNRVDFEPFLADEDTSFDRYIHALQKMGTYAGNDAIVAFARLHQVNIIIHQLNSPFLLIQGLESCSTSTRQLHIAYHNGDHYSSVRKVGDNTESPTNIKLKIGDSDTLTGPKEYTGYATGEDGMVRAVRDSSRLVDEVMNVTGCKDYEHVYESLADCDYDVDATIAYVMQTMEMSNGATTDDSASLASQMTSTDSGIWSENSSTPTKTMTGKPGLDVNHNHLGAKGHYRDVSYGGSSGYGSVSEHTSGARPKVNIEVQPAADKGGKQKQSSKQAKKQKKLEKKARAEEKHRMKFLGMQPQVQDEDADLMTVIVKDLKMARI
ncbi:OTU domain-containing protein 3-like [Mya arenaria]|uniref:OTU domain-containing protein 3-like n=1 Tax=Mya arenaria TaxID=6604 RepID=UPI0022E859AC|nr:OTU domain-containing protein 3-like [Mya arenaria]